MKLTTTSITHSPDVIEIYFYFYFYTLHHFQIEAIKKFVALIKLARFQRIIGVINAITRVIGSKIVP